VAEAETGSDVARATDKPRLELAGKLTLPEALQLNAWTVKTQLWRRYKRSILWVAIVAFAPATTAAIRQTGNISQLAGFGIAVLCAYHVWISFIFILTWVLAARRVRTNFDENAGDTTVRFFDDKLAMLSAAGLVNQLPSKLVVLHATKHGIVCATRRLGAPLFMLPNRLLTPGLKRDLLGLWPDGARP
jgi:hypothetical protein